MKRMAEKPTKTLVLHDYFAVAEGGGRLSKILAEDLQADLGYGFKVEPHPFFADGGFCGKEIAISGFSAVPLWRQFRLSRDFQNNSQFIKNYKTVIYSGSYAPLAVRHHLGKQNIYYCHTPPRFAYDQRDFFLSLLPRWQRPLLRGFHRYFQPRYEQAVRRMDRIVTNSTTVQQRIATYLGLDATVVHPPCDLENFRWRAEGDYFLSLARIDRLKRVELIVAAFSRMPQHQLIVASTGPDLAKIQRMSRTAGNITILGQVEEEHLQTLIGCCRATVYIPREEDFGMSAVESMAAGKPVIGVATGGLLETVIDGETGVLIPEKHLAVDALCQAVDGLSRERAAAMRGACERRAELFSRDIFIEQLQEIISAGERM
jgi:glycosyltransferase involved in cell wall biosynthesis